MYYKDDDFDKTTKLLDRFSYTFPQLFALSGEEMTEKLDVNLFPTLIIIKNGFVRHKGFLITNPNVIFNNTINAIDQLLIE